MLVAGAVAFNFGACGGSQAKQLPRKRPPEPRLLPIDAAVLHGRLSNGLAYYVRGNRMPENRAALWLAVNAGSVQEDDDQRGIAHLVEHMAFNGTTKYAKNEIVHYMERIGMRFGPHVNAYTSWDETVYMLEVPTEDPEYIATALDILHQWAHAIAFAKVEVDKERGVVLEERRTRRRAGLRLFEKELPYVYYGGKYVHRLPIGTPEIIARADVETIRRYYDDWYRPELMAVVAVGDFEPGDMRRAIARKFSSLVSPRSPRPRTVVPMPSHPQTLFAIVRDPEQKVTVARIAYKFDRRPQGTAGDYLRGLRESLFTAMFNDRLRELERGKEPPFLQARVSVGTLVRAKDLFRLTVAVNEGTLETGLTAVLRELRRVSQHGFTATELDRSKRQVMRTYEQMAKEKDKRANSSYARSYIRHYFAQEPIPGVDYKLSLVRKLLPKLRLSEVNKVLGRLTVGADRVVTIRAPSDAVVPPRTVLLPLFAQVARLDLEPWQDEIKSGPILPDAPASGRVAFRSTLEALGVEQWQLSNGVRVVVKADRFQERPSVGEWF